MRDNTIPSGAWQFDAEVTAVFDDMLQRSIPLYETMRDLCYRLGSKYVQHKTDIVDLGCSRGHALAPFIALYGAYNRYIGCDVSEPMLAVCRERYAGLINTGVVKILDHDLRKGPPAAKASLTLCVLTLQFLPVEYRPSLLRQVYLQTVPGGALLLIEKVLGEHASTQEAYSELYELFKRGNGYSSAQIESKRRSLENVMVPLTARANQSMLESAGFQAECCWRWCNFAGWLAIRQ